MFEGLLFRRAPESGCAWVAAVAEIMVHFEHVLYRYLFEIFNY